MQKRGLIDKSSTDEMTIFCPPISRSFHPLCGSFGHSCGQLATLQVHSYRCWPNNSCSHHPRVGQSKQLDQQHLILITPPTKNLEIVVPIFEHSEGLFHFGPNAGLDDLWPVNLVINNFTFNQSPALTRHSGKLPVQPSVLRLNHFVHSEAEDRHDHFDDKSDINKVLWLCALKISQVLIAVVR